MKLPGVTLMCIDCVNVTRAINVLEICKSKCEFEEVKLLTSIDTDYQHAIKIAPLNTLIMYSIFMLTKSNLYFDTPHVLIVQRDGFILNTSAWKDEWLQLDYIAPLFVQYDKVGSGGFSLRSKKLMDYVASKMPHWDFSEKSANEIQSILGYYEDGVISLSKIRDEFAFATNEQACEFAQGGNSNPEYYRSNPFGFHGTWQNINHETGFVSPVCEHKDLMCNCRDEHIKKLDSLCQ